MTLLPVDQRERIDALRAEVARRHNLLLDPSDPVLVTVTLCELTLASYIQAAEAAAERAERSSAARVTAEVIRIKSDAERMIGGAADFMTETIRAATEDLATTLRAAMDSAPPPAPPRPNLADPRGTLWLWMAANTLATATVTWLVLR